MKEVELTLRKLTLTDKGKTNEMGILLEDYSTKIIIGKQHDFIS